MLFKHKLISLSLLLLLPFVHGSSNIKDNQDGERFSLYNYTVFEPGSYVSINLFSSSNETKDFHFKLFKIEDLLKFISLSNRNNLRYNFDIWGKDGEVLLRYTKLVKEWDTVFSKANTNYSNRSVSVGKIDDPGTYILQATNDGMVAYCGISVSKLAMIYKDGSSQVLALVVNAKTGAASKAVKFNLYENGRLIGSKPSGKDGLALFKVDDSSSKKDKNILLMAESGGEVIFSNPYFFIGKETENRFAYVYTNQPVYRPGQQVYFKAIFRDRKGGELINIPGEKFEVKIKARGNREIYSDTLKTDEYGSLSGSFQLEKEAELGIYSIQLHDGTSYYSGSFEVQEYKKPEYLVKVETGKKHYAAGDTVNATVSADYYFGAPVTSGKVELKIFKQNIWRPWWYWSEYSWFYKPFVQNYYVPFQNRQLISRQSGELNKDGKYKFTYKIDEDKTADYIYTFEAEVTENSRNTVSGSAQINVTRGSFTLSTSPDKRFLNGGAVDIRVNASDFSHSDQFWDNKPVQTKFSIAVNYPVQYEEGKSYLPMSDTLYGQTDKFGRAVVTFIPRRFYPGNYNYIVTAFDEKGRKITAQNSFFIGEGSQYNQGEKQLEIVTDKDTYEAGDSLTAYIFIPQDNADILLTYEANSFLGNEVKHVEGGRATIKLKLTGKYAPSFNISAAYIIDRQLFTTTKMVGVLDKNKFLNIAIKPSKENYKPGEEASYKILVTDNEGKPVKNTELSVGVVDESIYAIKPDETPDIKSFFYAPVYSNIQTYSSLNNIYYSGSSRNKTLADEKLNLKDVSPEGSGSLSGKLETIKGKVKFDNIYVLLSSDSYFCKVPVDTGGNFAFNNIKEGQYELLALLDNGDIISAGEISVGKNSLQNINLGNYENISPEPSRLNIQPGILQRARAVDYSAVAVQGVQMKTLNESPQQFVQPQVRKDFADAAFWKADVVTDENGEAEISFKMPDNLTTWRTTVRGITKNSKVGQNTGTVITKKNLLVRLEAPRFFREDDEIVISTIVHNYLSEEKLAKVTFSPGNLKVTGSRISSGENNSDLNWNKGSKRSYEIKVAKDSEVRIDWKVKVDEPIGEAKLKAEALTNEESDAVEIKVPILPNGIKKIEPVVSDYSGDGTKTLTFNIPSDVDLRTAKLSFSAAPSLAGTILKSLDDLAAYPYGCVEQTMSRFLPTIIVAKTFKEIGAPLNSKTIEELPKMVEAGLNRLYNFQHGDGGWGWWTNDETNPYMTAYVIYGMSLAREAGYKVDSSSFKRGVDNLITQIDNFGNLDFTTRSYMLYSLSTAMKLEKEDSGKFKQIANELLKEQINPYELSLLALTYHNFDEPALVSRTLDRIRKSVVEENGMTYWGRKTWHYSWQNDKVQTTAFAVKALMLDKDNLPLAAKAVRWLLMQKQGFSWRSTQETASVIFGITDYLKATKELNPDFNVEVYVNNKKEFEKKFTKADVFENSPTITINGIDTKLFTNGDNKIKIIKTGEGKVYFSGISEYYSPDMQPKPDKDKFLVTRNYFILKPVNRGDRIVFVKHKLYGKVESGQNILVQTHVECSENDLSQSDQFWQYFILEDMLPSGFEAVKDENNFEIENKNDDSAGKQNIIRPFPLYYADREYHDSKVSFFVTNVRDGMDFSYIIQAQMPGSFNITPAQAYLMYYPEVNGNSKPEKITVKD